MSAQSRAEGLTVDELIDCLHDLDGRMADANLAPIEVRAVGGFAMAYQGLRPRGLTSDIDTATPTYPDSVRRAIAKVARERGLRSDWLNNRVVYSSGDVTTWEDVDAFDVMVDASYEPVPGEPFDKVRLSVADTETLIRTKAYAVLDIEIGWRTEKDLYDLVWALRSEGIGTLSAAEARFPWLRDDEFAYCRRRLGEKLVPEPPEGAPRASYSPKLGHIPGVDFDRPPQASRPRLTDRDSLDR